MNAIQTASGALLVALLALPPDTSEAREPWPPAPAVVVGTFDPRALVFAHVRSTEFNDYLRAQKADIDAARARAVAAGDDAPVRDLDSLGPTMQQRVHEQGFGTAPVPELLALVEDALPTIAAEAGVDVIVSKWDVTYSASGANLVDVTDLIVARINPDASILPGMHELMSKDPLSPDQLGHQ